MQLDDEDEYSAEANKQQEISLFPDHEELMITRVEQGQGRKRGRYIIHFGPYSLSVLEDVMIKYNMFKGTSFVKKNWKILFWQMKSNRPMYSRFDIWGESLAHVRKLPSVWCKRTGSVCY